MRGDEEDMAMVYAALIIKGKKTWAQVPDRIKPEVRQALIDLDCEYLIPQE
ncbi:MAG: CD1375 family protein [Oscillospiraceae bacterium]|nr:CD1375 family protein [Oscillospiraceae bacterium]